MIRRRCWLLFLIDALVSCFPCSQRANAMESLAIDTHNLFENRRSEQKHLSLEFYSEAYRSAVSIDGMRQAFYPSFIGRGRLAHEFKQFQMVGDIEGFITVNNTKNKYINVPEAYVGSLPDSKPFKINGGRKIYNWSNLDEYWRLGIWQPRFRWNYLEPQAVGLTGFFISKDEENYQLLAYGSPLFIPEPTAPLDLKEGEFSSAHPFVAVPPKKLSVFGQDANIKYTLKYSSIKDIIFNPGGGFMARIGRSEGLWGRIAYAYQPINQILLGYDGYMYLPNNEVQVNLYPRVVYHHMATVETGYAHRRWGTWLSVLGERPVQDETPAYMTRQDVASALLASSAVHYKLYGEGEGASNISLSYLYTWGGTSPDHGPLASKEGSLFETRYPYRNAISFTAKLPLSQSETRRFSIVSKTTYDFSVDGTLISGELRYKHNKHLSVAIGADVLGAARENAGQGGADFLYRYRANDRIRGGVGYTF